MEMAFTILSGGFIMSMMLLVAILAVGSWFDRH